MRVKIFLLTILSLFISFSAHAKPPQGFNEGPLLRLDIGASQVTFDHDEYSNTKVGRDIEPSFGITFGWNVWDFLSAELQGRYITNFNSGRREHVVAAGIHGKYFLITDALTNFSTLRIMPTVKTGLGFRIGALPGNPNSTDSVVTSFGWGPSLGAGLNFLVKKYVFFGIDLQEDFLFFDETRQDLTVGGVSLPNTLIYKGGFIPQFSAMAFIGVHY